VITFVIKFTADAPDFFINSNLNAMKQKSRFQCNDPMKARKHEDIKDKQQRNESTEETIKWINRKHKSKAINDFLSLNKWIS